VTDRAQSPSAIGTPERRLTVAAVLATGVVGTSVVIRVLAPAFVPTAPVAGMAGLLRLLVAVAALCLAALTVRRAPALAWLSVSAAAVIAVRDPAVLASTLEGAPAGSGYLPAASIVAVVATAAAIVAALYATRPERPTIRWSVPIAWAICAWVGAAVVGSVLLSAAGAHSSPAWTLSDVLTWPTQAWPVALLPLLLLGIAGDLIPAAREASRRTGTGVGHAVGVASPAGGPGSATGGTASWGAAFLDELLGRESRRRAGVEAERRRLATDLHAEVLPQLRGALRAAEAGDAGPGLVADLRAIADGLEAVTMERRDPVLEALGLIAALETLAERSEDRGSPPIELRILEVEDDRRPPLMVEDAALRVARLALDNAIRHAGAAAIVVSLDVRATRLHLSVVDDGRAIAAPEVVRARASGRRGILDMERAARDVGATFEVRPAEGSGTAVDFDWRL
jgi:signal transduction histidine kinase